MKTWCYFVILFSVSPRITKETQSNTTFFSSQIGVDCEKIFITSFFLFVTISQIIAQPKFILKKTYCNNYLYFSDPSFNNVVLFITKKYYTKKEDSCLTVNNVEIFSNKDGSLINAISIFPNDTSTIKSGIAGSKENKYFMGNYKTGLVCAFNISHDGLSFVIVTSQKPDEFAPYTIKKYLLNENRWDWEKQLLSDIPPLRVTYNDDNSQIIGVSTKNIFILNAETGHLIKNSDTISSISANEKYLKYSLSKNGKYFAFWWGKYLTWSIEDEGEGKDY